MDIYYANKYFMPKIMRIILSLFIMITFISENSFGIIVADLNPAELNAPINSIIDVNTFTISPELGTVKYIHKGKSDKVVFHIQDAHCNYDAQNKIYKIIETLNKDYSVTELNLEGGYGNYDLSVFTEMPDMDIRKKVAEHFVKWGEISGPELFALMNPEKVELWGIENIGLYLKNLGVYRNSLSYDKKAKDLLDNIRHYLNNLKRYMFNNELLTMDSKYAAYRSNNIDFKEYLEYLIKQAKLQGIELKKYPNIFLLGHVIDEEKLVDFKLANIQREILIKDLEERISKMDMNVMASKVMALKRKEISEYDFYEYLLSTAKKYGKDVKKYPKLHQYIIYVSMYNKVDKLVLMDEMDELETVLKKGFYENDEQKELDDLSRNLILLRALFDFSFTVRDYAFYEKNTDNFDVAKYTSFIEKYAPRYKIAPVFNEDLVELDVFRSKIVKFYEFSFKRDIAFLKNIKLSGKEVKTGVVVTGGFHTENLLKRLRDEDVSYISIMPNFMNKKGYKSPYFEILAGKKIPEFEQEIETIFFSIQVPSILNIINIFANDDARQRAEVVRIGALAMYAMMESGQTQVLETTSGEYVVFDMENGEPVVNKFTAEEFKERYAGIDKSSIIEGTVDLSSTTQGIWGLSRVAEENIKAFSPTETFTVGELLEEFNARTEGLNETLKTTLDDLVKDNKIIIKKGLIDGKGQPIAVSSNDAIYLSDENLDEAVNLLLHELVGGTFSGKTGEYNNGHAIASAAEDLMRQGNIQGINELLEYANRYADTENLWTMSQEELKEIEGMDFAGVGFSALLKKPIIGKEAALNKHLEPEVSKRVLDFVESNKDKIKFQEDLFSPIELLSKKMNEYFGAEDSKTLMSSLLRKADSRDTMMNWVRSMASFLDDVKESRESPVFFEFIKLILENSANSNALRGFGEMFKVIIEEEFIKLDQAQIEIGTQQKTAILDSIENLFKNEIHSGLEKYIQERFWEKFTETVNKISGKNKNYLNLKPFGSFYGSSNFNIDVLNGVARNSSIRNGFLSSVNKNHLEYLINIVDAYNDNKSQLNYKYGLREKTSESYKNKTMEEFLRAYLKNSNGEDLIGVTVGEDLISSILPTQSTKQVNILGKIQQKKKIKLGQDIGVETIVVSLSDIKDIFGKSILISPIANAPDKETLIPDSFLLRSYDGKYKIVLVDKENKEQLKRSALVAVNKMKRIKKTIGGLENLSAGSSFEDLIGQKISSIQDFAKQDKNNVKAETIRMFADLSLKYFNRETYLDDTINRKDEISSREKQMFDYMMFYAVMSEMVKEDNIYQSMDTKYYDEKKQPLTLAILFRELLEKNTDLFRGDNAFPLPKYWDRADIRKQFGEGLRGLLVEIGPEGNYVDRGKGSSAIGNIKLENEETVTDFNRQLNIDVDMKNGNIGISAQEGRLLNGDISLKFNTAPVNKKEYIESIRNTLKNETLTKNTLTKEEGEEVDRLIKSLENSKADIHFFSGNNQDNLYGFNWTSQDGEQKKIFLDEKMRLDPLSFFHETGEREIDLAKIKEGINNKLNELGYDGDIDALTNHTFLKGAGKKSLKAIASILEDSIQKKDLKKQSEALSIIASMSKSPNDFIKGLEIRREVLKLGELPEAEKALIRYNFATEKERSNNGLESFGLRFYLFGLQDHMDPYLNAEFTNLIKALSNTLNRGVHDIVVLRKADIMASSKLAQLRKMAQEGMVKVGHDLTIIIEQDRDNGDLTKVLERAYKEADAIIQNTPNKLPKVFMDIAYSVDEAEELKGAIDEVRNFASSQRDINGNTRDNMTVIIEESIENLSPGDAPKIDLGKLILVAAGLLDDKRRVVDFKMGPKDLKETRQPLIEAFAKNRMITLPEGFDFTNEEALDRIIKDIGSGAMKMHITAINWEEIRDWFEANAEIMRSL